MKKILTIALGAICMSSSYANIKLPSVIGSNMVLQQKSNVKLWGWCSPGEKIYVTTSWDNKTDSTKGTRDANWQLAIQTPAAGGPFTITIKGNNTVVLDNVMSGEVWVCSGQSNMEWGYQQGLQQVKDELPVCYNKNIRFFNIPKTTSLHPQDECNAKWEICDSNSLKYFSAIGYFFGKKINKDINVPIGLVNSNWGGTPAEVWTPEELVTGNVELQTAANKINPSDWWPNKPGYTYNAMIAPITSFPIAGALWYQGESNTGTAATYSKLFTTMIDSWRKAWNKEFPFYYVQIAPFKYGDKNVGALLREAQANSITHSNVGMAVITDLVADTNNIHPIDKKNVALRLANWALAETYHQPVKGYKSPMYKSLNVNNGKAFVTFQYAENGIIAKDKKITQLTVAGDDKVFYPAEAKIENGQLVVWSANVKNPTAVRYGFSNTAMGSLFGADGLPVCPFRTDNWEVDTSHN